MLQFAQDLNIDQPLAAIWKELNETDLREDDNLPVASLIPLLLQFEKAEGNEYSLAAASSIAEKYYENSFSVNASAGMKANLLIRLIALYYTSGNTTVLEKINALTGGIIRDMRICKTGMFWIDGRIQNEILFIHLQYTYCLAFHELGRCFGNESLVHITKPVLELTDTIADRCFQNIFETVSTDDDLSSVMSVIFPVEAMMMRMTIAKLAGEAGNSFIDKLQNQLTSILSLLPDHIGKRILSGKYLCRPNTGLFNQSDNNNRLLSSYPFIGLQLAATNKRSLLQYFYFTYFTLKEIIEEKTGPFTIPDFRSFCDKDSFSTLLADYKQHLTAEELNTVEALHEYELFKLNQEQYFLCFDKKPATPLTSGTDSDKYLQLQPQGRIFKVFRNHNISVMKTILETVLTDENFYTVFVYPDMIDRRVKEEVLTVTDEKILVAFSKPVSALAVTDKLSMELTTRSADSSLTKQGIKRKISFFEKKGILIRTQI
ncbi:hypothetical protein [Niastella sp. OAS944]|uniref:hypothetical protein n=1 Tax=Niastella sp. OAS944 TaxID=2664089 RepID=UPI003499F5F0|nr:hypothetical protein [Chitinophagaceae bacterium OAS944]